VQGCRQFLCSSHPPTLWTSLPSHPSTPIRTAKSSPDSLPYLHTRKKLQCFFCSKHNHVRKLSLPLQITTFSLPQIHILFIHDSHTQPIRHDSDSDSSPASPWKIGTTHNIIINKRNTTRRRSRYEFFCWNLNAVFCLCKYLLPFHFGFWKTTQLCYHHGLRRLPPSNQNLRASP